MIFIALSSYCPLVLLINEVEGAGKRWPLKFYLYICVEKPWLICYSGLLDSLKVDFCSIIYKWKLYSFLWWKLDQGFLVTFVNATIVCVPYPSHLKIHFTLRFLSFVEGILLISSQEQKYSPSWIGTIPTYAMVHVRETPASNFCSECRQWTWFFLSC